MLEVDGFELKPEVAPALPMLLSPIKALVHSTPTGTAVPANEWLNFSPRRLEKRRLADCVTCFEPVLAKVRRAASSVASAETDDEEHASECLVVSAASGYL